MQACAQRCTLRVQEWPELGEKTAALVVNSATNRPFDSNLCAAPICRTDTTDLST
jgi:hypothetical protein